MEIVVKKIDSNCTCCFTYLDTLKDDFKVIIKNLLLEIVKGKINEKLSHETSTYDDALKEAAKYIHEKSNDNFKVGIVGELLAHIILRLEPLKARFYSLVPTIGYSDSKGTFFKGFDGCYYENGALWLLEVKSKIDSNKKSLNKDNADKIKLASSTIESDAKDEKINRWDIAKNLLVTQFNNNDIVEKNLYSLLNKCNKNNYNQILTAMLIADDGQFCEEYIKKYYKNLFHDIVTNQKILLICIRNKDYQAIIDYIATL